MYKALLNKEKTIGVIGLGYVGLPLALAFAKKFKVIGFDINKERVAMMQQGIDPSKELEKEHFDNVDIQFTYDIEVLRGAHFIIVAVPTPVDSSNTPDLKPVLSASLTVGKILKKGDYVIFESTVYPGCTEEDCLPILEQESKLTLEKDFKIGYSPERINPGDKERTVEKILKIVSGSDADATEEIAKVYGAIITAGIYKASSIKVAEAAKVIENAQRDINIGFMNELAIIFDRMNIDTREVLEAAGTKWNFLKFSPGLVGGHCIGVDPYYLLYKSNQLGYNPEVITSGRNVNDEMPQFISKKLVQTLIQKGKNPGQCKVLIMGITFKENVSDIRNSKVVDMIKDINSFGVTTEIYDPWASTEEVKHEYDLQLVDHIHSNYDAVIVAVAHKQFASLDEAYFVSIMQNKPILFDIKAIYKKPSSQITYWRL